jgi:hypothetical protein
MVGNSLHRLHSSTLQIYPSIVFWGCCGCFRGKLGQNSDASVSILARVRDWAHVVLRIAGVYEELVFYQGILFALAPCYKDFSMYMTSSYDDRSERRRLHRLINQQ